MHNPSTSFAPQCYSLPLLNARTKNDLQNIDRFLEQLQSTVLGAAITAPAGVQRPGVHTLHTGEYGFGNNQNRSRNSPLSYYGNGSGSMAVRPLPPPTTVKKGSFPAHPTTSEEMHVGALYIRTSPCNVDRIKVLTCCRLHETGE